MASERSREIKTVAAVILSVIALAGIIMYVAPSREVVQKTSLSLEDNGKIIVVSAETIVNITVPENPSTGYTWQYSGQQYSANRYVAQVVEDVFIPPQEPVPGRGGIRMLTLRVIGSGEFAMDYLRPWENQSIIHFSVTFRVGYI